MHSKQLKNSFPKRHNHHAKDTGISNVSTKLVDHFVVVKEIPYMDVYMRTRIIMLKKRYSPKHHFRTWHLHCKLDFLYLRLKAFRKKLFTSLRSRIYLYVYCSLGSMYCDVFVLLFLFAYPATMQNIYYKSQLNWCQYSVVLVHRCYYAQEAISSLRTDNWPACHW